LPMIFMITDSRGETEYSLCWWESWLNAVGLDIKFSPSRLIRR